MTDSELYALVSLIDDNDSNIRAQIQKDILALDEEVMVQLLALQKENARPELAQQIQKVIRQIASQRTFERLQKWNEKQDNDLLEALWIIATYRYPELKYKDLQKQIEQIYYEVWIEFKPDLHPVDQIRKLNSVLFDKLKFKGDTQNFHAVSNSMLNRVLDLRKGNPISLSAVYMLIAQKLELPIYGVNLPHLFVLLYQHKQLTWYINVFNRGIIFSRQEIDRYVERLNMPPSTTFYQPCSHQDMLKRVLRNLIVSYKYKKQEEFIPDIVRFLSALGEEAPPYV
ncbi:MAG: transglutaminase family protein [Bernardetiaceae bacterium]|nr:transglutaminase family protein [Bernardetiaceae bacterium]